MSTSLSSWSSPFVLCVLVAGSLAGQQLAVEEAAISDIEGGFGVPLTYEFSAGQAAYLKFVVRGFQLGPGTRPTTGRVSLAYTIEAVDCDGRLIAPPAQGEVQRVLLRDRDRNFTPVVAHGFEIPATPRAGIHAFRVRVEDRVAAATASLEIPFLVQSPFNEPAPVLTIEQFRFFEAENADHPLDIVPSFRPGDTFWGRFLLSGFATGAGNKFDLQYGVSIRNTAGRTVFSEPKAAADSKESFYARTHVNAIVSVVLARSIRPGSYILVVTALDAIGNAQAKAEYPFRVQP